MELRTCRLVICFLIWVTLILQSFQLCLSVSDEGRALLRFKETIEIDPYNSLSNWREKEDEKRSIDPCSWFGVACSDDGKLVALNLRDLGLKGVISPEIGKLVHLRILDLKNNSFYGIIPREISDLKQLEVLDLRKNNLSGALPLDIANILSLKLLLIKGNRLSCEASQKLHELSVHSADTAEISIRRNVENATSKRRILSVSASRAAENKPSLPTPEESSTPHSPANQPSHSPPPVPAPSSLTPPVPRSVPPPILLPVSPPVLHNSQKDSSKKLGIILGSVIGGAVCLAAAFLGVYLFCFQVKKVNIAPWATGLSGPLRRAFVAGVPSLGRAELEAACEDFSNIIATLSDCTLYKGTLSSGVEIAVASSLATSASDWSEQSEDHFRNKISVLSKTNHKNFMNLLGYCEVNEPFTRMMVVEYAPNGTLFEHLHIREAEQLDWPARLRIAMGILYCLQYLEQLDPPVVLRNINSSSIYLTEDYAAKISDLGIQAEEKNESSKLQDSPDRETVIYKFAILLLEMISGRLPFSEDTGLLILWASSYLSGKRELKGMVDPTLNGSVPDEQLDMLCDVIRVCINPDVTERPSAADVARRMREITLVSPEQAIPRDSPLWWAELEIISTEGS